MCFGVKSTAGNIIERNETSQNELKEKERESQAVQRNAVDHMTLQKSSV